MSAQDNTKIARRFFELLNKNDANQLNALDEVLAPNIQLHDPATPNAKDFKQAERTYLKGFPNKSLKIESTCAEGDQVAIRWTCTATHKGEFQGLSPTNRQAKISGFTLLRISNNKISEIWQVWDRAGLLEQIGELQLAHAGNH